MKKRWNGFTVLSAILLMCLILLSAVSCQDTREGGDGTETDDSPETVTLVGGDAATYVIVCPEGATDDERQAAQRLAGAITAATSVTVTMKDDWLGKNETPPEREILIGNTNRAESRVGDELAEGQWRIVLDGSKLVIVGNGCCDAAVTHLIEQLLGYNAADGQYSKNTLAVPLGYRAEGTAEPEDGRVMINGIAYPVIPTLSAEESAGRIHNTLVGEVTHLDAQTVTVSGFDPDHGYKHSAFLTHYKGYFYMMYAEGKYDEADIGQRILYTRSTDGLTWESPKPLVDTTPGRYSDLVLSPDGWYTDGNTLVAFYYWCEYDPDTIRPGNKRPLAADTIRINDGNAFLVSTDGETFRKSEVTMPKAFASSVRPLLSGRLLKAGSTKFAYTDQASGLHGWLASSLPKEGVDNAVAGGVKTLYEGTWYQTADGIIHHLMRTGTTKLWCAESYDNGESWTDPYPTGFTNDDSKFEFGTLSDGRYYFVGTFSSDYSRMPLMLCLSEDGYAFSEHYLVEDRPYVKQQDGLYKGGPGFGYPSVVEKDGKLYIAYSRAKECIDITVITVPK